MDLSRPRTRSCHQRKVFYRYCNYYLQNQKTGTMTEGSHLKEKLAESTARDQSSLRDTFLIDGTACAVVLQNNYIKWQKEKNEEGTLLLNDVIGISKRNRSEGHDEMVLHYVWREKTTHIWTNKTIALQTTEGSGPQVIDLWVDYIQTYVDKLNRPRRLLVFINPASGNGQGLGIYEKNAAPLFKLAAVATDVIVTKSTEDAGKVISRYDLSSIDGVISVGGDGSLFHCIKALLLRTAAEAGKNLDNVDEVPVVPPVPVGIIPAGSGEGAALRMTLTRDSVTATLHIITGETELQNVYSVHNAGKLLGFGLILIGYGVSGDIFRFSDNMRYLGKLRYAVAIARAFTAKRTFDAEIHLKPFPRSGKTEDEGQVSSSSQLGEEQWQVYTGSFCDIHMFLIDISPYGMIRRVKEDRYVPADPDIPAMYFFEATDECGRLTLARSIYNMYVGNDSGLLAEHITMVKALEYKILLKEKQLGHMNVEGEVFEVSDPTIHVKAHHQLLRVFGAGYPKLLGVL